MNKKHGFGIIGCGLIANWHADSVCKIENAELIGVTDVNIKSASDFAEKYNCKVFSSVEEMLACDEVEVVSICTPSGLHAPMAQKAAEAGKHFVVEKPFAITKEQIAGVISACEKNKVKGAVISQLRFTQSVKFVKKAIEDGVLGNIILADVYMKYYRSPEYYASSSWKGTWAMDGGGALMNQGIHGIDLLQYIMGPVKSVQAISKTLFHNIETEDTLVAILEYENGAVGTVQATTSVYPGYQRKISVCGTEGTVVLCEDKIESWDMKNKDFMPVISNDGLNMKTGSRPDGMDFSLHKMQLNDFVECIKNNKKPFIDAYEGKKSVEIICAIYKSAKNGTKIYL